MMSLKTEGSKVTVEAKILHNGGEMEDFKNMSVNLFIDPLYYHVKSDGTGWFG